MSDAAAKAPFLRKHRGIFPLFLLMLIALLSSPAISQTTYPIRVDAISFSGGIGRGPTSSGADNIPDYYRGYGLSGTTIILTASMSLDGGTTYTAPMFGNVTFYVSNDGGTTTFPVIMNSGQHTATAAIPSSGFTGIAANATSKWTYTVIRAQGDYVPTPAPYTPVDGYTGSSTNWIYWNNKDQTGYSDIAVDPKISSTETALTIAWPPVDTRTTATNFGRDFYEYRVYYRAQLTSSYKQWNGSNDPMLRGLANNPTPAVVGSNNIDATGYKFTTVSNLQLFTAYEFYITAADVFGRETILYHAANATGKGLPTDPFSKATQPLRLTATITDGITVFSDFTNLATPSLRTLRETNIRVDIFTITTQTQPDECIVWFAPVNATPLVNASFAPNETGLGNDIDSVAAVRISANRWVAYLPTIPSAVGKHKIITNGADVRFAVQLKSKGIYTMVDRDSSQAGNTDWTFHLGTATAFSPQPTKILNNVLTSSNPTAYPSYYLTEDGYVTIKVYDIKGRPVATVLDDAFRRGGQNIKENGWDGVNKANRKVGIGLYYITITAKSARTGKVILDDAKKVVMKH